MRRTQRVTGPLLGRGRTRTLLSLGVALSLFLVTFHVVAINEARGWTHDWFAQFPLLVLLAIVATGAIAAGNAYWNDGLVVSWLLVFAPVLGWLWNVFVQPGPVFLDEVVVPLAWAGFAALVVGSVGHAVGRGLRLGPRRDGEDEPSAGLLRALVGGESRQPVTWGFRAGGLFLGVATVVYATRPGVAILDGLYLSELFIPVGVFDAPLVVGAAVIVGWLGLAAWPAYRNEGLFASWLVTFGPFFGATLTDFVTSELSGSGPLVDVTLALLAALVFAGVLGTGGFALGRGLRRVVVQRPPDERRVSS